MPRDYKLEELDLTLALKRLAAASQLKASTDPELVAAGKLLEAIAKEALKPKRKKRG